MANPITIIIFGGAGDLALRKLMPALYRLWSMQKLDDVLIIGAGKSPLAHQEWIDRLASHILNPDLTTLTTFLNRCFYVALDFDNQANYGELALFINQQEQLTKHCYNRLVYCATSSDYFEPITRSCLATHLIKKQETSPLPWYRIAYEKPFGHNYASAKKINACIKELLNEEQVFRIDHFLGKSLIDSIAVFRFTNRIFSALWDHTNIESVALYLNEEIDIQGRGSFYDATGTLRDVVQNHMMQMLALIAMEAPEHLSGSFIQDAKAAIINKCIFVDGILGQYQNYRQEHHVNPHSTTETFAALILNIATPRWQGVPFYLQTGKCLDKRDTSLVVTFKPVKCLLDECPSTPDQFIVRITPESIFELSINTKKPGEQTATMPIILSYCYSCVLPYSPLAYETIFEEIIAGEQSISVRFDEIEAAWRLIDTIRSRHVPLYNYTPGSEGPTAIKDLKNKYIIR